jgi:hypothetical protein
MDVSQIKYGCHNQVLRLSSRRVSSDQDSLERMAHIWVNLVQFYRQSRHRMNEELLDRGIENRVVRRRVHDLFPLSLSVKV